MDCGSAIDLDALEAATTVWLRQRAEFAALSDEGKRAPGVPAFWHSSRRALDMLDPQTILELVRLARLGFSLPLPTITEQQEEDTGGQE